MQIKTNANQVSFKAINIRMLFIPLLYIFILFIEHLLYPRHILEFVKTISPQICLRGTYIPVQGLKNIHVSKIHCILMKVGGLEEDKAGLENNKQAEPSDTKFMIFCNSF